MLMCGSYSRQLPNAKCCKISVDPDLSVPLKPIYWLRSLTLDAWIEALSYVCEPIVRSAIFVGSAQLLDHNW
jgi:hypothetical protein